MESGKIRLNLERLIREGCQVAPSITRFEEDRNYGNVTDEGLDHQYLITWEIEAKAILEQLAESDSSVFIELYNQYLKIKKESEKYHSSSILVHRILQLLASAQQLMDSQFSTENPEQRTKIKLNPWPIIRGMVLSIGSYEVPEIIDRTGLTVDWSLSEKQDYSHKYRLAAYRPRIDAAFQSLLNDDDRLRVAYIVARELSKRGFADELNEALREIGWEIREDTLVVGGTSVRQLFFPDQAQHDAYVEIRAILQKSTSSVWIVDPYIDQSMLTLLTNCANPQMRIRLLTSKLPSDFILEAIKWRSQNSSIALEVRKTKEFHDRFLVIDDTMCWHVGCSIKDAGNKAFMLSQVEDDENRTALLAQINKSWDHGVDVL